MQVEKALIAEFDRLKTEGITERELQRAKNQFARDYIVSRLSIKEKASQLGHAEVIQKDMASADGEFDTFQKVTLEDIRRVAQEVLRARGPDGDEDHAARWHVTVEGDRALVRVHGVTAVFAPNRR